VKKILYAGLLLPFALLVWWPLWFMVTGAITSADELAITLAPALTGQGAARWSLLPSWPTLQPVVELLLDTPEYFVMFWNTTAQVFPQMAGQFLVGAPAAWALARLHFRGRKAVQTLYLVLMLLPFQVTMVPNYLVLDRLGLLDSPWAVILPGIFSTFPVFIMQRGFAAVPPALLEAAAIDGAGPWQRFWHIGLPVGAPGVLAALTLAFLEGWNALEQPMLFLKTPSNWPLSLYLTEVDAGHLGVAMAASLGMLAPAVLVFRFGQPYLELGVLSGSLKE